jgi:ribokinase
MLVCTFGDLLLDVVVAFERELVEGGDVPARTTLSAGGQAANVAAWVAHLGQSARLVAKRADDDAGRLASSTLGEHGVEIVGPVAATGTGVVVSLVAKDGERSLASDRGSAADLRPDELEPPWFACTHLHVSGYALNGEPMRTAARRAVALAREQGARVSVDVAASTLVDSIGADAFRALLVEVAPDTVFCNEDEDAALGGPVAGTVWIVKRGARGASVDGVHHPSSTPAGVVDATGAGDAFAAGWIVGGISLALDAAARCVAHAGAMP